MPSKRRTRASAATSTRRTGAAAVLTARPATPEVWAAALELAGGDRRRLEVEPGGSVLVRNP